MYTTKGEAAMTTQDSGSKDGDAVLQSRNTDSRPAPAVTAAKARVWIMALGLSMLAGVAAWLIGEYAFEYVKPSKAVAENYRDSSGLNREMPVVNSLNG